MEAPIEVSADTLEAALAQASEELGVEPGELGYEVIDEGKKGVLGLGARQIGLRAWIKSEGEDSGEAPVVEAQQSSAGDDEAPAVVGPDGVSESGLSGDDLVDIALDAVDEMLDGFDADADAEGFLDPEGNIVIELSGPDMGGLIGRRGQTLEAIQYLLGRIVSRAAGQRVRVLADAEGYRARRQEALEDLAHSTARKATDEQRPVALRPMSPAERRIIHMALADDAQVETHSEGEEPERKVVVAPR